MSEAIDPCRVYTSREVADLVLRHPVMWFYRHRRALRAMGFPRPVSPFGQPRWNGADLIAWLNRPSPAEEQPGFDPRVVDFSAVLATRARSIATGAGARRRKEP